jgi:hypothetical protein
MIQAIDNAYKATKLNIIATQYGKYTATMHRLAACIYFLGATLANTVNSGMQKMQKQATQICLQAQELVA